MATLKNTQLMDIIKEAVDCEEIIFESEEAEANAEEEVEEYEIIDIIEEFEEPDEQPGSNDEGTSKSREEVENHSTSSNDAAEQVPSRRRNSGDSKQLVQYDVSKDWEDEDLENLERSDLSSTQLVYEVNNHGKKYGNKRAGNELGLSSQSKDSESTSKKARMVVEYEDNNEISNDGSQNEIIREENDLVYTVLEPKKQNHSSYAVDNQHKLDQQVSGDAVAVEDAIFYEGDNALYVTSQSGEEGEQYEFNEAVSNEQEWENSQQSVEQQQDEDSEQGQIYLHEDEDGQLYFKDDNGTMQPVYLTEDGNYAIAAGSSGDEQDSQEGHADGTEIVVRDQENDSYIIPDLEVKSMGHKVNATSSIVQDVDNEDSTVTISLIISEDEHGQKRTQVIIPTTENLKCDICHKTFKTSFQLLKHNRLKHAREEDITTRNFPCDLCPKRFPDQNSLARHRKTHTGDRPFQCLECQKTFPTATTLRRHLTLHNPQSRPLPCIYCGRRFLEKASLAKHEQSHLAGEMKSHVCDICHKTFNQASELTLHKKNHDPDRKFDCEVCGREFNRLNNLQRHMMVHQQQGANEEILSCEVCGITYKFMSSLTRHMVTTHMNPEKMRQQAEEQRRKRENNYRRYLENRKMYETQNPGTYAKRAYHKSMRLSEDNDDDMC